MKSRSNPFLRTAALAAFSLTLSAIPADAATVTWSGVTGADWDAGANWSGSAKPATADAALFNLTGITSVANAVADQTVTGITFDTAIASTNAFTLGTTGGYALILQDTGTIQILSTLTSLSGAKTITVNAPLELAGTSYNFVNDNATGRNTLKFGGVITSTSGTTILTLGGANAGGNTISGVISDGFSGTLGVAKTGNGAWVLAGSNTYTGGTTVSNGALTFLNTNAKPSSGTHAFAAGTTLGLGVATSGSYFTSTDIDNAFSGTMTGNLSNVTVTATTSVGIDTTAGNFTYTTSVGGSPAKGLMKFGANTLTLGGSGNNTYTGTTTLGGNGKILLAKTGGATAIAGDINLASTAWNGNNSGIVLGGNEQIADTSILSCTATAESFFRLNGYSETLGGLSDSTGKATIENRGNNDTASYGTGTLKINTTGSNSYSFGGTIRDMDGGSGGGAVAIVKSGTGTQTLTGNKNTYTGTTAVNGGVLSVGTLAANGTTSDIGKGTTLSFDGGTLRYTGGANTTFNRDITLNAGGGTIETANSLSCPGVISGTAGGAFIKTGAGALTLGGSGNNTYTGTTTLGGNGKILLAKTGGATAIAGDINLASTAWNGNNSGIVLGGNEQIADTSILSCTATAESFFRLNGYSETLGGLSDSTGKTTIENRGNGDGVTYGTGTLKINTTGSSSYTFGGTIRDMDGGSGGGAVAIVKSGTGTQTLTGNKNIYTGTTAVNGGVLSVGTLAANGTTSDIGKGTTLSFDGGTLSYTGGANTTFNRDITLNAGGGTIETASSLSCPGVISGTTGAAFIKTGAGALTLGGSGNNTYTGTTTLGGTGKILLAKTGGATAIAGNINLASTAWNGNGSGIVLGGNEQIADTSILTWTTTAYGGGAQAPSFFRLNGNSETIGGLVGSGANAVIENRGHNDTASYGTGTLTINTTGSSSCTFGGTIRDMDGGTGGGAVAIVKSGTGTQTLTGTNVYTGTTTVTNGTLHLAGGSESSPITVNNGAFLGFTLGTTITSSSSVTLDSGSKIKITGTPTLPSYTLIATTSGITGTPVLDTAIPGYALVVDGTSLKLNASGSPYTTWAATFLPGDDVSNPAGDNDNDGLFNQQEFAFGLSPISGSSVNPILVPLDKTTGTFTYQRRAGTGLTYRILTSTDLVSWPEDVTATASQVDGAVDGNGNQIVVVTLSGAKPLTATKLFVRVAAD